MQSINRTYVRRSPTYVRLGNQGRWSGMSVDSPVDYRVRDTLAQQSLAHRTPST